MKLCRYELLQIEACFECYYKANTGHDEWFIEVCSKPHLLLWAKLRGFPFWPAKAMNVNEAKEQVLVNFFGEHQHAWIDVKNCFLYSFEYPLRSNSDMIKQSGFTKAKTEMEQHIQKLSIAFDGFEYAPLRIPYDLTQNKEQLEFMLPNIEKFERTTDTRKLVKGLVDGQRLIKRNFCPKVRIERLNISEGVKLRRQTVDLSMRRHSVTKQTKTFETAERKKGNATIFVRRDYLKERRVSVDNSQGARQINKRRMTADQTPQIPIKLNAVQPKRRSRRIQSAALEKLSSKNLATGGKKKSPAKYTPDIPREIDECYLDFPQNSLSSQPASNTSCNKVSSSQIDDSVDRVAVFVRAVLTDSLSEIEQKNQMLETEMKELKRKHAEEIDEMKQEAGKNLAFEFIFFH